MLVAVARFCVRVCGFALGACVGGWGGGAEKNQRTTNWPERKLSFFVVHGNGLASLGGSEHSLGLRSVIVC